jgi:peptide/nickel transport system substrate-binding protein
MLRLFYTESTYVVLYHDADTQAYRNDRFQGWLQQPAVTGPVIFSNSSPTYENLTPLDGGEGGDSDDGGLPLGLIIGLVAVVVGAAIVFVVLRRRSSSDDRE